MSKRIRSEMFSLKEDPESGVPLDYNPNKSMNIKKDESTFIFEPKVNCVRDICYTHDYVENIFESGAILSFDCIK